MGTDRENIVSGNLCSMKANFRYQQKAIFSIKKSQTCEEGGHTSEFLFDIY